MPENPNPTPLELKKEDKRRRILFAALVLFAEKGFSGTAVPEISKAAGVGAGTIYRYFESKEVLVNAVFRVTKTMLSEWLDARVVPLPEPEPSFRALLSALFDFARTHPVAFHFLELQDHAPYLDDESREVELSVLTPIRDMYQVYQAQGLLKPMPPDAAMALVWGSICGLIKAERLGYLTVDEHIEREAIEACWRMIGV
jgi:TetR/AcrR family transcriptional regulator, repressor of fatR-cypB operon